MPDGYEVKVHQFVFTMDDVRLKLERTLRMPIPPFVGMTLLGLVPDPEADLSEWSVQSIEYDVQTGDLIAHLKDSDYVEGNELYDEDESDGDRAWGTKAWLFAVPGVRYADWSIVGEESVEGLRSEMAAEAGAFWKS